MKHIFQDDPRLRTLFEKAGVGLAELDAATGRFLSVNDRTCEILGESRDRLGSMAWQDFSHPDEMEQALADVAALVRAEASRVTREYRVCRSDKAERWIRLTSILVDTEQGGFSLFVAAEDVTDIKRAESTVLEAERRFAALSRVAPIAIGMVRWSDRRYVEVNEAFTEIFGWTREEALGKTPWELGVDPDQDATAILRPRLLAEGAVNATEVRLRTKAGTEVVSMGSVAFADIAGERCAVGFFQDVTEQRAVDVAMRRGEAELRTVFDQVPIGISQTDPRTRRVVRVNRRMSEITGYSEDELLAMRVDDVTHPDDRAGDARAYASLMSGEVSEARVQKRYVRKDGAIVWANVKLILLRDPSGEPTRTFATVDDVTERKQAEAALADAHEWQRLALATSELATWRHDIVRGRMQLDERARQMLGFDRDEVSSEEQASRVHPDDRPLLREATARVHDPQGDGRIALECRIVLPSGEVRWISTQAQVRFERVGDARRAVSSVVTARDVTEARQAGQKQRDTEEQLRAAQKMEAIGRLAGGVAHDFNNLLSVILSYADMAAAGLPEGDPVRGDLAEIVRAAERGEGLTRQLLAFSRKQVMRLQSIDLNELMDGIGKMLRRLIGEDIALEVRPGLDLDRTRADRGQLEQVLMNLAVNARDAMPDGGLLVVRTANATLDAERAASLEVAPGAYVELTVSDTGSGMDAPTLARIFEPFFTTKGIGKGTGLGLSTVYGIVHQSGGGIVAESSPGAGTEFRIYLKRDADEEERAPVSVRGARGAGRETVMVVEDEEALRRIVERVLTGAGYTVLAASGAEEAMRLGETSGSNVQLVLTDVIMPGVNGRELVERLKPLCPSAKVLFMSGYTDDAIERLDVLGSDLLRKPFSRNLLMQKVRDTIDGRVA